jgi:outer membrane immunogenic protein
MFRKILMTTVAASAMVGSAFAADLPSRRPPPPVAYVPPVPIFTWTGFYIGVNGGGMFRANNRDDFANAAFFGGAAPVGGFVASNNNSDNGRFLIGGQAGVNWQINQFVLGIEGDGAAVLGQNHNNITGFFGNNGRNTGFLGTVRGRGGIAFDRLLVYGTGGVAFGSNNNEWGNTFIGTVGGVPTIFTTNANNNTRVGYAVGAGVEYAFLDNWSVKVEYLFVDLGRTNRSFLDPVTGAGFVINHREQDHVIRAGLNYKFNWGFGAAPGPVVARY